MAERIIDTPIVEEVEQSFLDYSLSVITDRAIPSAEDGLKPVVRRILYTMLENGITSDKPYKKCADAVGRTMAEYHPHGDSSIYGALVNASQSWNMRYPLIDFHGNNGSRDGDGPAHYRYTEARLSKIAEATMTDIKKQVVNFLPNYSESGYEPEYLPGLFPNLLCNGTTGIAVAMACTFAPHNLNEVMDAIIDAVDSGVYDCDRIMTFIQGPDFPTGGIIINKNELPQIYKTGKGRVRIRGEYIVETKNGAETLVFTSIPYKVSKEQLVVDINELCDNKEIEGISTIRDESNKQGVRFVIELEKGQNADTIANKLFKLTKLEDTYSVNQVALNGKTPQLLNIADIIKIYCEHQMKVFLKATSFDFDKINNKLHIQEGLYKALEHIDEIIKLIKNSESSIKAKENLIDKYGFSDAQAKAILDMKLSRLAKLEKVEIENGIKELTKERDFLFSILNNKEIAKTNLIEKLTKFKKTFSDNRITKITQLNIEKDDKEIEYVVPENVVVVTTKSGNIKRIPSASFRTQKKNGKGVKTSDGIVMDVLKTNTIDTMMFFTNFGKMYKCIVDNIPIGTNVSRGTAIETLVNMEPKEKVIAVTSLNRKTDAKYVFFVTKKGTVKKTPIEEYTKTKRSTGIIALGVRKDDELSAVTFVNDEQIILITRKGMSIKFKSSDVLSTSRTSIGVKGINLSDDDEVICALPIVSNEEKLAIFSKNGLGRKSKLEDFPLQNRGGRGTIAYKTSPSTGDIADAILIKDDDNVLILGMENSICINSNDIPTLSKTSIGNQMIKENKIISASKV